VQSTKERRKVPWAMGSVVYLKGGTDLVCSEEGGGVYILLGGRKRVRSDPSSLTSYLDRVVAGLGGILIVRAYIILVHPSD